MIVLLYKGGMLSQLPQGEASRCRCLGRGLATGQSMFRGPRIAASTTQTRMIQQRSISLLSSAERHLLRQNRASAERCIRCIHTSEPVKAEENKSNGTGNDKGTPYNTANRGPSRQERAAKVSSEVSAVAADLPKANLSGRNAEVNGAQPKSPDVSPQSQGIDVGPGRMGENDGARKEGPFAQGVGRVVRGSDEDPTYSKEARGIRTPDSKIETPSEGGASVMQPMGAASQAPVATQPNAGTEEAPAVSTTPSTPFSPLAPAVETAPSKTEQTIEQYLHSGTGTATLLNSNFPGIIADRAAVLSPRSSPSTPTPSEIAHRLHHYPRQLTAFRTQADKEASTNSKKTKALQTKLDDLVEELRTKERESGKVDDAVSSELREKISALAQQIRPSKQFRPLRNSIQRDIINRMVLGKYDGQGLLRGEEVHKQQPLLNTVARELLRNSTYLAKDSEQLMNKLRGLLPTAAAVAAASKQRPAAKA